MDDEMNNGDAYGENGNGATPEIAITQIYAQPVVAQSTEPVTLGVEAQNRGEAESSQFKARYSLSNGDTQEFTFPGLRPGQTHYEDWNHAPLQAGNYTFSALLDADNEVQESSKDDNSASMSFMVEEAAAPSDEDGQNRAADQSSGAGQSVEIEFVGDMFAQIGAEDMGGADAGDMGADSVLTAADSGGGGGVKSFVEIGSFVYDVMKDSQPTSTISGSSASVIPAGATLDQMTGWSGTPHELRLTFVSKKNAEAIVDGWMRTTVPFVVQWYYGGRYQGRGQYINRAVVFVDSGADIGSFYDVNITCDLTGAMNMGTDTDPLVHVPVRIEVEEKDKISPYGLRKVYAGYIQGDGEGRLDLRS